MLTPACPCGMECWAPPSPPPRLRLSGLKCNKTGYNPPNGSPIDPEKDKLYSTMTYTGSEYESFDNGSYNSQSRTVKRRIDPVTRLISVVEGTLSDSSLSCDIFQCPCVTYSATASASNGRWVGSVSDEKCDGTVDTYSINWNITDGSTVNTLAVRINPTTYVLSRNYVGSGRVFNKVEQWEFSDEVPACEPDTALTEDPLYSPVAWPVWARRDVENVFLTYPLYRTWNIHNYQYAVALLPPASCYLKVWLLKKTIVPGGYVGYNSNGENCEDSAIGVYEWDGVAAGGGTCLPDPSKGVADYTYSEWALPFKDQPQLTKSATFDFVAPDHRLATLEILKYSFVRGYEPDPCAGRPNGYPDPSHTIHEGDCESYKERTACVGGGSVSSEEVSEADLAIGVETSLSGSVGSLTTGSLSTGGLRIGTLRTGTLSTGGLRIGSLQSSRGLTIGGVEGSSGLKVSGLKTSGLKSTGGLKITPLNSNTGLRMSGLETSGLETETTL